MIVKPYSKKELANLYGISIETLRLWFKKHSIATDRQQILTIKQVNEVFEKLGTPNLEVENL